MHNMIIEDDGEDAATALEFENMVILSNFQTRMHSHSKSLFKCINKFGIDQLMNS